MVFLHLIILCVLFSTFMVLFVTYLSFHLCFLNVKFFLALDYFMCAFCHLFTSGATFWYFEIKFSRKRSKEMNKSAKKNEKVVADLVCFLSLIYFWCDFLVL